MAFATLWRVNANKGVEVDGHGAERAGAGAYRRPILIDFGVAALTQASGRQRGETRKKKDNERDGRPVATPGVMARLVNRWEFDVADVGGMRQTVDSGPSRKWVVGLRVAGVI
jgi:hypothetical protein